MLFVNEYETNIFSFGQDKNENETNPFDFTQDRLLRLTLRYAQGFGSGQALRQAQDCLESVYQLPVIAIEQLLGLEQSRQ